MPETKHNVRWLSSPRGDGTSVIEIDDVTLRKGESLDPVVLNDDQLARLKRTFEGSGFRFEVNATTGAATGAENTTTRKES